MVLKANFTIKQFGEIRPSKDFKNQAKCRLMQRILKLEQSPLEKLLVGFQKIKPSEYFHLQTRERLFYRINQKSFLPTWIKELFTNKKIISIATVTATVFVSFFAFAIQMPQTVEASNEVRLLILGGDPQAKHLGEDWQDASQMQAMRIGDKIKTDYDDVIEILFFDNSVTRLDYNTEITITGFYKQENSEEVALELSQGRVWNKVIKTFADVSDFSIKTHNSLISAQNATFDVAVETNQPIKIMVVDHLIDVKILGSEAENVVAKTKVTEGYAVEVQVSDQKTVAQTAQIKPVEEEQTEDIWFTENIEKDKAHLKNLQEKHETNIIASAGILPTSPLYSMKKTLQGAKGMIQNADNEQKSRFEQMQQAFQEAAVLKTKSEDEKSKIALGEFKNLFLEASREENLKTELITLLAKLEDDYIAVVPNSDLYEFKEVLQNLQIQITDQPEMLSNKLKTGKLFEAQDLIENGSLELATALLASLNNENEVALENTQTGAQIIDKKLLVLQKTEELQILQSLKDQIREQDVAELAGVLDAIHQNTMQEIALLNPEPKKTLAIAKKIITVDKEEEEKSTFEEFMSKLNIYKSERGKLNQLQVLLNKMPNHKKNIPVLVEIRKQLPLEQQHLVTQKILEITK